MYYLEDILWKENDLLNDVVIQINLFHKKKIIPIRHSYEFVNWILGSFPKLCSGNFLNCISGSFLNSDSLFTLGWPNQFRKFPVLIIRTLLANCVCHCRIKGAAKGKEKPRGKKKETGNPAVEIFLFSVYSLSVYSNNQTTTKTEIFFLNSNLDLTTKVLFIFIWLGFGNSRYQTTSKTKFLSKKKKGNPHLSLLLYIVWSLAF